MKNGFLIYDERTERWDIAFTGEYRGELYGGLHCGDCFDVKFNDEWMSTRLEMSDVWYLVGLPDRVGRAYSLRGLEVRI